MFDWKTLRDHANPPVTAVGFSWRPYYEFLPAYIALGRWDLIDAMIASGESDFLVALDQRAMPRGLLEQIVHAAPEKTVLDLYRLYAKFLEKPIQGKNNRSSILWGALSRKDFSQSFWVELLKDSEKSDKQFFFWRAVENRCHNCVEALKMELVPGVTAAIPQWVADAELSMRDHSFKIVADLFQSKDPYRYALFQYIAGSHRQDLTAKIASVVEHEVRHPPEPTVMVNHQAVHIFAALVIRANYRIPADIETLIDTVTETNSWTAYQFAQRLSVLETGVEIAGRPRTTGEYAKDRAPENIAEAWGVLCQDMRDVHWFTKNTDVEKALELLELGIERPLKHYQIYLIKITALRFCADGKLVIAAKFRDLLPDSAILGTEVNSKIDTVAGLKRHQLAQHDGLVAWRAVLNMDPPCKELERYPVMGFKPVLFAKILPVVQFAYNKEYPHHREEKAYEPMIWAYKLCCLFSSEDQIADYMRQHGNAAANEPVHDLCQFGLPKRGLWTPKAWGDLAVKYGPGLTKYLGIAPGVEKHLGRPPQTLQEIKDAIPYAAYSRGKENIKLAQVCADAGLSEDAFNRCVDLKLKISDKLPDVTIDGAEHGHKNYKFYKLPCNDYRGLVLGQYTNNCQSVGGHGERAAVHGATSEYGGFYVVAKITPQGEKIVAQSWAWLAKDGELVFDSIEPVNDSYTPACKVLYKAAAKRMKENGVPEVRVGTGGKTPKMGTKAAAVSLEPADTKAYDASKQYVLEARTATGGGGITPPGAKLYHDAHLRYM